MGVSNHLGEIQRLVDHRLVVAWDLLAARSALDESLVPAARMLAAGIQASPSQARADREVAAAFRGAGIDALVLKGALVAHTVYERPGQRLRGDTDWLVRPDQRVQAEEVLAGLGFDKSYPVTAKTSDTQDLWQRELASAPVLVDLHWRLLNHPALFDVLGFEELWQRRQWVETIRCFGLSRVDALLHAALHYFGHHAGEFRPDQWLLDMDLLWRSLSGHERNHLVKLAGERGVAGLLAEGLALAVERFDTPVPTALKSRLALAAQGQWRTSLVRADDHRLLVIWLKLRGLRTWGARWQFLGRLLFPAAHYMRSKYPAGSMFGMPGLYARRIFEGLGGGGRHGGKAEMNHDPKRRRP